MAIDMPIRNKLIIIGVILFLAFGLNGCITGSVQPVYWEKFSDMNVPPDLEPTQPWLIRGNYEEYVSYRGILSFETGGTGTAIITQNIFTIDNTVGTTAEIGMKFMDNSPSGSTNNLFLVQDGSFEGKIAFSQDRIEIYDQNELLDIFPMLTWDKFHIYRIAIIGQQIEVFVDGNLITSGVLTHNVPLKAITFGDFSVNHGENLAAEIDYIAYAINGAWRPNKDLIEPTQEMKAPVVKIEPSAPEKGEALKAVLVKESIVSDQGEIDYHFVWYRNGELQTEFETDTIPADTTQWNEIWSCTVTPVEGRLTGSGATSEVTIGKGFWTKFSSMTVNPESEPGLPWEVLGGGAKVDGGILTISTRDTGTGFLSITDDRFDNSAGTAVEVRLKVLKGPVSNHDASLLLLQDGQREGKVSFFDDRIEIRDRNMLVMIHEMNTTDEYHTYRMVLENDGFGVYVDGESVTRIAQMQKRVENKRIIFGDVSVIPGDNLAVEVDYIAYAVNGSWKQKGDLVESNQGPKAPVVKIEPSAPENDEMLKAVLIKESTGLDGGEIDYHYAWYRDGVLQPELTSPTVPAIFTQWDDIWTCLVTPTDGTGKGSPATTEVTIGTGIWTKFSGMRVSPIAESEDPWQASLKFQPVEAGIFKYQTSGKASGLLSHSESRFNNDTGTTLEIKLQVLEGPVSNRDAALISLQDGEREGKLSFFTDRIEVYDRNNLVTIHEMDTTDGFHTYRLTITSDSLGFYVDGEEVAAAQLVKNSSRKVVLFGDAVTDESENFNVQVDYIAYSIDGALAP